MRQESESVCLLAVFRLWIELWLQHRDMLTAPPTRDQLDVGCKRVNKIGRRNLLQLKQTLDNQIRSKYLVLRSAVFKP